jgi:hypothetical protein
MQTVAATARRANMEGETVPANERVFSFCCGKFSGEFRTTELV